MKTSWKSTCLCAAALALAVIGGAQPVEAACGAPFLITSIDPEGGGISYVITPGVNLDGDGFGGSSITDNFTGSFWAIGFGDAEVGVGSDNGGWPALSWMYTYPGYNATILTTWAESPDIDGCIDTQGPIGSRCQATLMSDVNPMSGEGVFALITTPDDPVNGDIVIVQDTDFILAALPGLDIPTEPTLGDEGVTAEATVPELADLAGSLYVDETGGCSPGARGINGLILGVEIRYANVPAGDPAPAANDLDAWTAAGPAGLGDTVSVTALCDTGVAYFSYTVVFDGGFQTGVVGAPSAASSCTLCGNGVIDPGEECDPPDAAMGCNAECQFEECVDDDGDGYGSPGSMTCPNGEEEDCDDNDPNTFPGAPELCDGIDNNCDGTVPDDEADDDGDGFRVCEGDCDDDDADAFPGAPQLCDGINNDCDDPAWPTVPADEIDDDADTFAECEGDCDDADATTYPGAPQLCDRINNDCDDPAWPTVPADEIDADDDLYTICGDAATFGADCDDFNPDTNPGAPEICSNDEDNNCNGLIGEDDPECPPLLVELESFTARATREGVLLEWTTAVEIDNVGFRLLRAQSRGVEKKGREVVLEPVSGVILSAGTPFGGADYSFVDSSRQPIGVVQYYLESIDRDGRSQLHGPVQVSVGNRGGNRR